MWCHFTFQSRVVMSVTYILTLAVICWVSISMSDELDLELEYTEPPMSAVLPSSPQFVVRLPDKHLLCFSVEGYELFTYNLITSNYLVLNGFLSVTSAGSTNTGMDLYNQTRGFQDIGMIVKAVDRRVRAGKRYFRHVIYGEKKKAILGGFGEVDLNKGAVTFTLNDGRSNIESQQSPHEKFRLVMDKPRMEILVASTNGHTYDVYVEDSSGLLGINIHGLIGQFYHPKVRISDDYTELRLADGRVVPVEEGVVFRDSKRFKNEKCWHPVDGQSVIEGHSWNYIVEHIMSTKFKHSLYKS